LGFVLSAVIYFVYAEPFGISASTSRQKTIHRYGGCGGVLITTCTGVSFAHGTNDGQKSIGLIMLTIIGLFPAIFALNPDAGQALADLPRNARAAKPFIEKYGDDRKDAALTALNSLEKYQAAPRKTFDRGLFWFGPRSRWTPWSKLRDRKETRGTSQ
jgi:phosphate/sulfate permease